MGNGILVIADHRERNSDLYRVLDAHPDIELRDSHLPVGDYVIAGNVTVERKTVPDLSRSLEDGRLFRQAARLKRSALRPVLLIEGASPPGPHRVRGALTALSVMWYLPVLWATDADEAAATLVRIGRQLERDTRGFYLHPNPRKQGIDSLKVDLLRRLPGIGNNLATRLLTRLGSIDGVMRASADALREVPGIGRARADRIRAFLEAPPQRHRPGAAAGTVDSRENHPPTRDSISSTCAPGPDSSV